MSAKTVAALLEESHLAHQAYRDNLPRRVPAGPGKTQPIPGDAAAAQAALQEAYDTRKAALFIDQARTDPAWQDELPTYDHDALMRFYAEQLHIWAAQR